MTDLWLIRHGSTDVLDDRIAGWTPNVELNAKGHSEVRALAARVAESSAKHVYSSALERAFQTAEPLATTLACPLTILDELGELHFGEWTNQRFSQLKGDANWHRFNHFRSGTRIPGGESYLETQARAVGALFELRTLHPHDTVLLVSHGDVIKAMIMYFLGMPVDLFQRFDIAPASLSRLELSADHARLRCLNDTAHLVDQAVHTASLPPITNTVSERVRYWPRD